MKSRTIRHLTVLLLLATLTVAVAPAATAATALDTPVGAWWSDLVSFLQTFWTSLSPDKDDVPPPSIGPWADPSG